MLEEDVGGAAELEGELNALGDIPDGDMLAHVTELYQRRAARRGGINGPLALEPEDSKHVEELAIEVEAPVESPPLGTQGTRGAT